MSTRNADKPRQAETTSRPVQRRLLIPLTVVLVVLLVGFGAVLFIMERNHLAELTDRTVEGAAGELARSLDEQADTLSALLQVITSDAALCDALTAGDRQRLLTACQPILAELRRDHAITHFYFHGPDRVNLLRVHKPDKHGDLVRRFTAREAERTGRFASGIELGPLGTFTLRSVQPLFENGQRIGYVELGKEIEDALDGIHEEYAVELAVAIRKDALSRVNWEAGMELLGREADWGRFTDDVLIYTTLPEFPHDCERFVGAAHHTYGDAEEETSFDGKSWRVSVIPLTDVSGTEVGDLIVLLDLSAPKAAFTRLVALATSVATTLALLLFVFFYIVLRRTDRGIRAQEEQARESEQRFMDVLRASDDAILLIDGEAYVDCNEATARMLDYSSRDEFLMTHPSELSPPEQPDGRDSFEKAQEMMQTAFENGSHRFEWMHRKAGGEDFPVEVTLTAITYHGRSILHCLWRDLTKEKQAKEERERSRKTTESILESMPVGVVIIGRDHILRYVNSTALAMMGYGSRHEILGRECHEVLCPAQRNACPVVHLGKKVDNSERVLITKDKKEIPILKTVIPVTLDGEDVLLETFVDISKRKAAEGQLRKLSSAIEQNPASIVITDSDGKIEYVNPGFTQTTGYTAEEALGENPRVLRSDAHPLEFYQQMWATLKRGEVWRGEICNRKKSGDLYWEDATIAPVKDDHGATSHFVAVKMDISERKRAEQELKAAKEEAEAANRTKSQFLASMSHELRTPLTGILGFTDLLLGSAAEEQQREYLQTIRSSGDHLLELINGILDLSKIEVDRLDVERAPCAPHGILNEVVSIMRAQAQAKGLELRYRWSGSVPRIITTDGARLRQILLNLVGNAVKFTPQGVVEVVSCLEPSGGGHTLHVEITDTGIGIAEEKLETIFEPFVQADNSVTREFGGTGLGLAISARLARVLGGDISVTSELGAGSTFTVSVDAGDLEGVEMLTSFPADGMQAGQEATPLPDISQFRSSSVLLVEDGHVNRKLISAVLERAGLSVSTAENGEAGVELATGGHFDLILMDMQMPVLDGYAAARKLRSLGCAIPIIALTAAAMKGDEEKCLAAGCSHYVSKPIAMDTLLATVAEALGRDGQEGVGNVLPERPEACFVQKVPDAFLPGDGLKPLVSSLPTEEPVFRQIVRDFVERFDQLLTEMRQAAAEGDGARLAEMAHSLRGSAGTVGFGAFTEPTRQLEALAKQQRLDAIGPVIDKIAELAGRIRIPTETHDTAP